MSVETQHSPFSPVLPGKGLFTFAWSFPEELSGLFPRLRGTVLPSSVLWRIGCFNHCVVLIAVLLSTRFFFFVLVVI